MISDYEYFFFFLLQYIFDEKQEQHLNKSICNNTFFCYVAGCINRTGYYRC